jgi:hypothetical chaperone protein
MSKLVYAVDFGTSNSLLAAANSKELFAPIPLDPEASDPTILRSLLFFPSQKQCYYGSSAIKEFKRNDLQGRLIRSIKKFLPIRSFIGTFIDDRPMNLEDIIAVFLGEMRRRANEHFNQDVDSIVLGRPARFSVDKADDDFAQYRLERAARGAGFKNIEFVPEPLAAAFELRKKLKESKTVLVADFGGGTSDYTVIRISPDAFKDSDVLAISGVPFAGDALDGSIMKNKLLPFFGGDVSYVVPFGSNVLKMPVHLVDKLCSPADMSILRKRDVMEFFKNVRQWSLTPQDTEKMDRLFCLIEDNLGFDIFEEIEGSKRRLSASDQTKIQFNYPTIDLDETLTRREFESCVSDPLGKILSCLDETLKLAQLQPSDIDLVFCTGGTAKVPLLNQELIKRFGIEKIQERNNFHSIVEGLAVRARELA